MKWKEILRKEDIALLQSESDTQYAVVSGYDPTQPEDQQWSYGTYFTYWNDTKRKAACLQNALDRFREKTEEHFVNRDQEYLELHKSDFNTEEYVIGVLFPTDNETTIKYVTEVQTDPKVAKWEDGKEAKTFSKDYANDLVFGLCMNGYPAISIIKTGCLLLENPEKKTEANFENNTKKEE